MEDRFEWNSSEKEGCGKYCSKCRGEVGGFTKRVDKEGLQSLLASKVHGTEEPLTVTDFMKVMKKARKEIFHANDVPPVKKESQIHAVCLQMVAAGIVTFKVKDLSKMGTEKVSKADLCIVCPNVTKKVEGKVRHRAGYLTEECWEGFNLG